VSRVSRNIIYNGLGQGLSLLLGFVAVRFVYRKLGGDALGLIYFTQAFSLALTVAIRLGILESAVREVASHHADRPQYMKSFVQTCASFYWAGYLLVAAAAWLAAPYLVHHWVKLTSLGALTAIRAMRILCLGALAALPGGLYRALLVGLQRMGVVNLIDVGGRALQQGGTFLILLMHGSLFHVVYWIATCMVLQLVANWAVCGRYFVLSALLLPGFSRAVVKQNIGYASRLFTTSLCWWASGQIDQVIISKLLPLTLLGMYSFTRGAINQGMLLTVAINNAIFPHFCALHGAGKREELKRAYNHMHDLICLATIPLFALAPFAAIPVFSRVFDTPSAHRLLLPATFLCIGYYLSGTLTAPSVFSLAVGRPDISARQNLLALLIAPPVSIFAIRWFGLNGAGFSWIILNLCAYSYGLPRICRECLGIPARSWYARVLRILGLGLAIYGAAWVVLATLGRLSAPYLGSAYALGTLVYGTLAFRMMSVDLRQRVFGLLCRPWVRAREVLVAE
jgi:O-antigen/teichoic acid export membrane protein